MKFMGGTLTAADLPRLEANLKRLRKIVNELKKEQAPKSSAEQFWQDYQIAVQNISRQPMRVRDDLWVLCEHRRALGYDRIPSGCKFSDFHYGDAWKVRAKSGETVLARLPTRVCKHKGPRGGEIRYMRDQRLPAAEYWPSGQLPNVGLEIAPPPSAPATWEGQHPMLASLNEFLESEREQKDNDREIWRVNCLCDGEFLAQQHKRKRIVQDICEEAERMEFHDPDRVHIREVADVHYLLDKAAQNRAKLRQLHVWCIEADAEQLESQEYRRAA